MEKWLRKTTSYAITQAVLLHIEGYNKQKQVIQTGGLDQSVQVAALYQATIGPRSFGEGLLSTQWQLAQQRFLGTEASMEKSKRWVSKLIQKLWEISWNMWEFRNGDVHSSADTRRKLYAQGIFKEIGNVKIQASFCMLLTARERRFFETPVDTLKRMRERSQLDWICRAEQFISSTRLSRRLQLASGQFYQLHAREFRPAVQQRITQYTAEHAESDILDNDEAHSAKRQRVKD